MKDLERIILEDIATLDDMRLIEVIGFIRYLKMEKPVRQEWIAEWYESALKTMREREKELHITPEDIREQIKKLKGK
jgi:hypothetical protein